MPFTTHGGARLYWKLEGAIDRPPLVLLNSIGTDMGPWDRTLPYLPLAHVGLRGDRRRRYLDVLCWARRATGLGDPRRGPCRRRGAHLPPIENPAALAGALRCFLLGKTEVADAAATLFEAGLLNRRRVLSEVGVDRSLAGQTRFNADFQSMITRIARHEICGRLGLDDRTRRLLVLAITASLGRWEAFALHVRAGLSQGGLTGTNSRKR